MHREDITNVLCCTYLEIELEILNRSTEVELNAEKYTGDVCGAERDMICQPP
uniref:Uncharacterized protein n=1 Tax=Arion vulgaris TaxID=1028688 RepID=A0A0B6Z597_9EUPU